MSKIREDSARDLGVIEAGLRQPTSRRGFVRKLGAGSVAVALPGVLMSCDDDDDGIVEPGVRPVTGVSFDLRTDAGFLRLVQVLEEVEAFFYTAVVANSNFNSFFPAEERELFVDLRDAEIIHLEVVRAGLGSQAVPSLAGSINMTTLTSLLSSRTSIIAAARGFETLGVSGLNGSGKYLQDARNLLFAGKVVSVEGRHLAALRDISVPAGNANTAFASDDTIDSMGRDIKLEAGEIIARAAATNILLPNTLAAQPISFQPTAAQGVPTPSFITPTP
ncbi:MAG: ferritin-like domain-containing protein [Gemmatimonadaceae bacterium]|nr:ferritin-like domain-containing protein [Gemmatimonadaceae bacterium]